MRLINADALMEKSFEIEYADGWHKSITKEVVSIKDIDNAPTIKTEQGWIPCSERLPSESGDYLVWIEDESEHYAVIPFDADAEDFGWWQDYYHPVSLGFLDSEFIKAENVTAWQSLPKPYREDGEA